MSNPQQVREGRPVCGPAETKDTDLGSAAEKDPSTTSFSGPNPGLFHDIPSWIWGVFLAAWAMLFCLFIIFFAADAGSAFVVTIAALFGLMAFGLPMTLAAQSNRNAPSRSETINTHTGPLSVRAAAAQIVLIPIGAVIGLIAFISLAK
jgi:hypothetical protein